MTGEPPTTVIVEPHPSGHRFQWVSHVARAARARGDDVVLLTSTGGGALPQFHNFLGDLQLTVHEPFDGIAPSAEQVATALVDLHGTRPIDTYVITEADQLLKTWWRVAPRALRGRRGAPKGVLLYGRFPSRVSLFELADLQHRIAKTALALLALVSGAAYRVVALVGRDETNPGWFLKRVRDPAICGEHARDRARLRSQLDLPQDRHLVGILGIISMRKSVPMVLDAVIEAGPDVDLLLAGPVHEDVRDWMEHLEPERSARICARLGYLSEEEIDGYTAASDICVTAHLNKGPSGIMGKAQVAGVPVLSAGSEIRRRETSSLGGVHTDLTATAMAAGIREILSRGSEPLPVDPTLPTAQEFGHVVLGLPRAPSLVAARGR